MASALLAQRPGGGPRDPAPALVSQFAGRRSSALRAQWGGCQPHALRRGSSLPESLVPDAGEGPGDGGGEGKRSPVPSPSSTRAGQDGLGSHSGFPPCQPHADPEPRARPQLLPTFAGPWSPLSRLLRAPGALSPQDPPHWHPHCGDGETAPEVPPLPSQPQAWTAPQGRTQGPSCQEWGLGAP